MLAAGGAGFGKLQAKASCALRIAEGLAPLAAGARARVPSHRPLAPRCPRPPRREARTPADRPRGPAEERRRGARAGGLARWIQPSTERRWQSAPSQLCRSRWPPELVTGVSHGSLAEVFVGRVSSAGAAAAGACSPGARWLGCARLAAASGARRQRRGGPRLPARCAVARDAPAWRRGRISPGEGGGGVRDQLVVAGKCVVSPQCGGCRFYVHRY